MVSYVATKSERIESIEKSMEHETVNEGLLKAVVRNEVQQSLAPLMRIFSS